MADQEGVEREVTAVADDERVPTVIAENAHIIYRIHGSVSAARIRR